jgi:lipoprotein-anchoring transpeptidase ErfK/SrfK
MIGLIAVALGACGSKSSDTANRTPETTSTTSPAEDDTLVATSAVPELDVYEAPDAQEPKLSLDDPTENGGPVVLLVNEEDGDWLNALLPVRPNGSTGWIRRRDVTLAKNPYRIEVRRGEHRLIVTKDGAVVADDPIAVGTGDTPTPGGSYYLVELLQPSNPNGPYGSYAYGISGFSEALDTFAGGDGVIGIHGTNDPSAIGRDVSHGCIRLTNEAIEALVPLLPLGTPVEIVA